MRAGRLLSELHGTGTGRTHGKAGYRLRTRSSTSNGAMASAFDVKTALAVVAPPAVASEVNTVRSVHDKAFERWMPHINIVFPFADSEPMYDTLEAALRADATVQPFTLRLVGVHAFKQKKVATFHLQPDAASVAALNAVFACVKGALPAFVGANVKRAFTPHMTVAQFPKAAADDAMAQLAAAFAKPIEFDVTHIHVLKRGPDTPFAVHRSLSLA